MDLQKVKEYLEEIATRNIEDNALDPEWPNIVAKKAIDELESLEEGALSTVIKWAEGYFDHDIITGAIHESLAVLLNQYAESYHAKKCAECVGNLPAFPHKPGVSR